MQLEIQDVSLDQILDYTCKQDMVGIKMWERVVLDSAMITPMLRNGAYSKLRKSYGLFVEGVMVGYAVTYPPENTLDLLHITKGCRGNGLAEWFLRDLCVDNVSVDVNNQAAINLYTKLGYEIDLIKE